MARPMPSRIRRNGARRATRDTPRADQLDSPIPSSDNDRIEIGITGGGGSSGSSGSFNGSSSDIQGSSGATTIPFGGELLFALLAAGYGVYLICKRR